MLKRLFIQGMHCQACVEIMQDNLSQVQGINFVQVNLLENYADLDIDQNINEEDLLIQANEIANKDGFNLAFTPFPKKNDFGRLRDWIAALAIAAVVLAIFKYVDTSFMGLGMGESGSILMPLSVGFAASLSSCLALTGSVVISFTSLYRSSNNSSNSFKIFKINSLFQLGRLSSFFIGGAILAIVGTSFALTGNVLFVMYFIIAFVLLFLSLSILDITKSVFSLVKLPSISVYIKKISVNQSPITPYIAGALTLLLPCGFSLSMMIVAMQSTSLIQGALTMLFFALGTLPVLFIVGMTASYAQNANMLILKKAMGFLVLAFAIHTFSTAFLFFGFDENMLSSIFTPNTAYAAEPAAATPASQNNDEFVVEMTVNATHFLPRRIVIPAGKKIVWNITGDNVSYCSNKIIVPSLKIKQSINNGSNQVQFTAPDKPQNIKFSCWMGHITGMFVVE